MKHHWTWEEAIIFKLEEAIIFKGRGRVSIEHFCFFIFLFALKLVTVEKDTLICTVLLLKFPSNFHISRVISLVCQASLQFLLFTRNKHLNIYMRKHLNIYEKYMEYAEEILICLFTILFQPTNFRILDAKRKYIIYLSKSANFPRVKEKKNKPMAITTATFASDQEQIEFL